MEHQSIEFAGRHNNENRTVRMDIRKGHFSRWMGKDTPTQEYDYIQGKLLGISIRNRETQNGEMTYLDLHFANGDTRFDVSAIASSSISAELISKLANLQDTGSQIRIDVWPKGSYTNCIVYENGQKLPYRFLPKVERRQNGFNTTIDTSERDAAVMKMIHELNARLGARA